MLDISILAVTAILNLLVGSVVYIKNPRGATNRLFFALTIVFTVWSSVNYLSVHPVLLSQLVWVRLVLCCGALLNLAVFLTFLTFPNVSLLKSYYRWIKVSFYSTIFVMALTLTPFVFKTLKVSNGHADPVPEPGIGLFLLQTVGLVGASMVTVVSKYRSSKGLAREQLRLVLLGVVGTFTLIVISNFLLVVFFNITSLVPFGSAFTLVFSFAFADAIVRHRLFDIRTAIARSIAYLLVIGAMITVYSVALFGLIDLLFKGSRYELLRQLLSVALIAPLALSFQAMKRFFDRLTNRLFYRENYDTQAVLDEIGTVMVEEFELYKILNRTRSVLNKALKSSSIEFILFKEGRPYFESHTHRTIDQYALELAAHIDKQHQDLMVTDEPNAHGPLREQLLRADVSLSLRLKTHERVIGYVVFGPKRSGDVYSSKDRRLLLTSASELAITVQNALHFEEIQNFNITLQARVDEATRQLKRANERLRQMDETKDDFISMASHQLRTPLTSVKGYISMVLEGDAGKITHMQREMLGQAFFSSQRMVYLIADLLNVSRLKTGKFIIEPLPVNLADMVEQELGQLKESAASRSLELSYDKPKHFPMLMLDETKTRQVVMNFIDNAIYYTPSGGHITVRLLDKDKIIELRVEDDGIGVPKSEQPHLFTKFYRAGNARKARPDGTGLGLFMARKVIAAQEGSIIFESQEGKGSTFGFIFDKAKHVVHDTPNHSVKTGEQEPAQEPEPAAK